MKMFMLIVCAFMASLTGFSQVKGDYSQEYALRDIKKRMFQMGFQKDYVSDVESMFRSSEESMSNVEPIQKAMAIEMAKDSAQHGTYANFARKFNVEMSELVQNWKTQELRKSKGNISRKPFKEIRNTYKDKVREKAGWFASGCDFAEIIKALDNKNCSSLKALIELSNEFERSGVCKSFFDYLTEEEFNKYAEFIDKLCELDEHKLTEEIKKVIAEIKSLNNFNEFKNVVNAACSIRQFVDDAKYHKSEILNIKFKEPKKVEVETNDESTIKVLESNRPATEDELLNPKFNSEERRAINCLLVDIRRISLTEENYNDLENFSRTLTTPEMKDLVLDVIKLSKVLSRKCNLIK